MARSSANTARQDASGQSLSQTQLLRHQIVHRRRVGLAAGGFQHLSDEPAGQFRIGVGLFDLGRVGGDAPISIYGVRWYSSGVLLEKATGSHANVDWNNNGVATNTGVAVDLNNSGGNSVLRARFNEWENIIYDGGDIGPGLAPDKSNMLASPEDLDELTYEKFLEMEKAVKGE